MADLISRAAVLNGISDLQKSPWYNDGKGGERHVQYLARKDAVEVVKVLCVEKETTVDAVPVTWLRNLCAIAKMETDDEMFIDWLIQTWHEEQEAGQ